MIRVSSCPDLSMQPKFQLPQKEQRHLAAHRVAQQVIKSERYDEDRTRGCWEIPGSQDIPCGSWRMVSRTFKQLQACTDKEERFALLGNLTIKTWFSNCQATPLAALLLKTDNRNEFRLLTESVDVQGNSRGNIFLGMELNDLLLLIQKAVSYECFEQFKSILIALKAFPFRCQTFNAIIQYSRSWLRIGVDKILTEELLMQFLSHGWSSSLADDKHQREQVDAIKTLLLLANNPKIAGHLLSLSKKSDNYGRRWNDSFLEQHLSKAQYYELLIAFFPATHCKMGSDMRKQGHKYGHNSDITPFVSKLLELPQKNTLTQDQHFEVLKRLCNKEQALAFIKKNTLFSHVTNSISFAEAVCALNYHAEEYAALGIPVGECLALLMQSALIYPQLQPKNILADLTAIKKHVFGDDVDDDLYCDSAQLQRSCLEQKIKTATSRSPLKESPEALCDTTEQWKALRNTHLILTFWSTHPAFQSMDEQHVSAFTTLIQTLKTLSPKQEP